MKRLLFFAAWSGCLLAADARIESPVIGYVVDSELRAIRRVLGIPGASQMSEPMSFGEHTLRNAWIAPGGNQGLAATTDRKLYRFDLPSLGLIEISADVPEEVVWSPAGSSAALRYSDGRTHVLMNLGQAAQAGIDLVLDADATDVAVADDGSVILAITARDDLKTLTAFTAHDKRSLLTAPGLQRPAFLFGSTGAVVSDAADGTLYMIRNSGELTVLARIDAPTALALSTDNTNVFVANAGRAVAKVRISDGTVTYDHCSCTLQNVERLNGDVFRVISTDGGPTWIFNAAAAENPFTFVPHPEHGRE